MAVWLPLEQVVQLPQLLITDDKYSFHQCMCGAASPFLSHTLTGQRSDRSRKDAVNNAVAWQS